MAVATTGGIVHLPFTERPDYGSPFPEGIAVGHIDATGDASGGGVSGAFIAETGFLYRLELANSTRGSENADAVSHLSSHRWATDRSGLGNLAFDLNWGTRQVISDGFALYVPEVQDLQMLRRFPIGRTDVNPAGQTIWAVFFETNFDTILYDMDVVFSYWRTEAMYRPGFLAQFWETPFTPVAGGR